MMFMAIFFSFMGWGARASTQGLRVSPLCFHFLVRPVPAELPGCQAELGLAVSASGPGVQGNSMDSVPAMSVVLHPQRWNPGVTGQDALLAASAGMRA